MLQPTELLNQGENIYFLTVYTENIMLKRGLPYSDIVLNFNLHAELLT